MLLNPDESAYVKLNQCGALDWSCSNLYLKQVVYLEKLIQQLQPTHSLTKMKTRFLFSFHDVVCYYLRLYLIAFVQVHLKDEWAYMSFSRTCPCEVQRNSSIISKPSV